MKKEGCLKTLWCAGCHSMSPHQLRSDRWVCLVGHGSPVVGGVGGKNNEAVRDRLHVEVFTNLI